MPMADFQGAVDPAKRAAQNVDHFTVSQWQSMLSDGSRNNLVWNNCVHVDQRYIGCVVWYQCAADSDGICTSPSDGGESSNPPGSSGDACEPISPAAPTPDPSRIQTDGSVEIDPRVRGLAGMDTAVWVSSDATSTFSWTQTGTPGLTSDCEQIPAPTRQFSASVDQWRITIEGEGDSWSWSGSDRGSRADPLGSLVFDRTGDYTISLEALITGDVSLTALVAERSYEVIEVRARLEP